MSDKQREDLDWLAFRYVAAELSEPECRQFEERLEHDQRAREAVGRAVEVTCAVRALDWDTAPHVKPVGQRHAGDRRRSMRWLAALAVGVALVVFVARLPRGEPDVSRPGGWGRAVPPGELAVVWSSARMQWEAEPDGESWDEGQPEAAADHRSELSADAPGVIDMPDWMIVAVVALASEPQDRIEPDTDVEGT